MDLIETPLSEVDDAVDLSAKASSQALAHVRSTAPLR